VEIANSRARQAEINNVSFIEGDLTKDLGNERFDLIYSVDVMEHIKDDTIVFRNFHASLKPNGILILHVPKRNQKFFLKFSGILKTSQDDHVREGYDEDEIRGIIKNTGFEILTIKNTFAMFTSFMWEIMKILHRLGSPGNAVWLFFFSLLRPVVDREFKRPQKNGNGLLVVARAVFNFD